MKLHNLIKEGLGNRSGGVRLTKGDEVCILGESVHDMEKAGG